MNSCLVTDFEKVCRICMKFDQTFLTISSFKIIDMIIECASVQIWENDDLPNQICNACFLQLQNTINFKLLCVNSDNAFRQIIEQNKINSSNNQNNFNSVKDEEFDDYYDDDITSIDIKEEDILENITNENTLENVKNSISHNENNSKKSEKHNVLEIRDKIKRELIKTQIRKKEGSDDEIIKDNENVIKTITCEIENCHQEFKKLWTLGYHMRYIHRAKGIKCNKCKLRFYHPLHLKEHQELAHNPSNRTCKECNKVFSSLYNLRDHKCTIQHLPKLLPCLRCDKLFKDKQERKCHVQEVHRHKVKYIACHVCGRSITSKNFDKHLKTHEDRDKLACHLCSNTYKSMESLRQHIKRVHENRRPECNHLCNICGHAMRTTRELSVHLLIHSNERPYVCDRCDKRYRREDNLKAHIKSAHFNERKHQCKFCPQAFAHKNTLMNHERRHTGEKPHKCEVCDKRFIQPIALKIHMKTHTNTNENLMGRLV